ncbi:helix-turn-helix transcriptional regulator [Streptomyces mirabilis]
MPDQNNGIGSVPAVVVQADDPLARDGTVAFMEASERVHLLPEDRLAEADVMVVITAAVTGKVLSAMSRASHLTGGKGRIVLIADHIAEPQVALAVSHGMVSFLVRPYTSFTQIVTAVVESHKGRADLPPELMGILLDRIRAMRNGKSSGGLLPVDLAPREVEVLRLLAEGMDIVEIASKLSYSERLIKSVIHTAVKRLETRNRTHAVAYAIRMGVM